VGKEELQELAAQEASLDLLRELGDRDMCTQRELSLKMDVSLGKVNYLLKKLVSRGLVSVKNFSSQSGKAKKVRYILTPKGFTARIDLTRHFLEWKEVEYLRLKKEWERLSVETEKNQEVPS